MTRDQVQELEELRDILALTDKHAELSVIESWTDEQRLQAMEWAGRVHLRASDNHVRVPECPEHVRGLPSVGTWVPQKEDLVGEPRMVTFDRKAVEEARQGVHRVVDQIFDAVVYQGDVPENCPALNYSRSFARKYMEGDHCLFIPGPLKLTLEQKFTPDQLEEAERDELERWERKEKEEHE